MSSSRNLYNKTIIYAIGTRAEAIKMAPLFKESKKNKCIKSLFISSGQHSNIYKDVLEEFDIQLDFELNLKIKKGISAYIKDSLEETVELLGSLNPTIVAVHGDTASALLFTLAAKELKIKVAHIESGIRSNILNSPFPEEIIRLIVDHKADYLFPSTYISKNNLIREGINPQKVKSIGNTFVDNVTTMCIDEQDQEEILIFLHRRETLPYKKNLVEKLINRIIDETKFTAFIILGWDEVGGEILIPDSERINYGRYITYKEYLRKLRGSKFVITDSCGILEEACFLGKKLIIARKENDRPETSLTTQDFLSGIDPDTIFNNLLKLSIQPIQKNNNEIFYRNTSKRIIRDLKKII